MQSSELQQQMFNHIEQWQNSGLSQKTFCQQINLAYNSFHYWYRRYRLKEGRPASAFIKLGVSPVAASSHMELIMPDGKRLVFHQPVSADYLKVLIN